MSAVNAVVYLLTHNAPLLAAVPAEKIMPGAVPLDTVLPAIEVNEVSLVESGTVAMNGSTLLATSRVQVTVLAKTYPTQKSILELVRKALPVSHTTVNGIVVDCIIPDGKGPDMRDDAATIFMQSRDFIVSFQESAP
jgi:hypothetical protein